MILKVILLIIISYLMGSIPFGYFFSKWFKGVDIRTLGSGNTGGMNVLTKVGILPGVLTGLCDIAKGLIPVLLAKKLGLNLWMVGAVALAPICGHNWPLFLSFQGGQGIATSLGAITPLLPLEVGLAILAGVIAGFLSGFLSLPGWFSSKRATGGFVGLTFFVVLVFVFELSWAPRVMVICWCIILLFKQIEGTVTRKGYMRELIVDVIAIFRSKLKPRAQRRESNE